MEKVFHRQVVISDTRGGPKIVIRFLFCYKKNCRLEEPFLSVFVTKTCKPQLFFVPLHCISECDASGAAARLHGERIKEGTHFMAMSVCRH